MHGLGSQNVDNFAGWKHRQIWIVGKISTNLMKKLPVPFYGFNFT
jgi:hypothetical protein